MAREITQGEKAAIYYHLVARCTDWHQLYKIAKGNEAYARLTTEGARNVNVSKWKNSEQMKTAIKEIKYILEMEKKQIESDAIETHRNEEDEKNLREVDFLDRGEFLKYLNKQANRIKDEKVKNDYLKMISDNLRFKDADKSTEEDQEIRRFYTPVLCSECEIYKKCSDCSFEVCPR